MNLVRSVVLLFCMLILGFGIATAQSREISGLVLDNLNEPLIGALIAVKEDNTARAITDIDGRFKLNVLPQHTTLVVSYLGMKTLEVKIEQASRIVMQSDAELLQEVVVTGMVQVDKRLFTGATDRLSADKTRLEGIPDISRALEGRSAGVSVQNVSGTFGTAPRIRVRGATSIFGAAKPLWVVDGVIIEPLIEISGDDLSSGNAETLLSSAIAGLNAEDIESFQILKDGSATSIYGARAMAGVVSITTKKGAAGVSRMTYTGEFSTRLKPNYSNFNISNSQQQMGIYREMAEKRWLEPEAMLSRGSSGVYGKMYELIRQEPTYDAYGNPIFGLENSEAARNAYLRDAEFRNTDWFDQLFRTSLTQNHTISMTTGSEKARFYASLSAYNDPGWYESSSVERYTANFNSTYNILPNLNMSLLANGSYRDQTAPGTMNRSVDVVRGEVKRDFDINPYSYALNTSRTLDPDAYYRNNYAAFNIFNELNNNYIDLNVLELKFQGEINWNPIKYLKLTALMALRYSMSAQEHHIKDNSNQAEAYRAGITPSDNIIRDSNTLLYVDPDNPGSLPITTLATGGIYTQNIHSMRGVDARFSASYNNVFNDDHIINLYGGTELNDTQRNATSFQGWGYQYDRGGNPYYDYIVFKQWAEEGQVYYGNQNYLSRFNSVFGYVVYSYQHRYTLNTSGRYEGSNRLGKSRESRWLPTWNVSGVWTLHEEEWFNEVAARGILSHASLKSSYSLTADSPPATNALPIFYNYTIWRPTANVSESGLRLQSLGNRGLTYEKKYEFNLGTEIGFLKNRINLAMDVYWRDNFDLMGPAYTTGVGGEAVKTANVAAMKSSGLEISLSTRNVIRKNFSWSTNFIFADTRTKVTNLDMETTVLNLVSGAGFTKEGYPHRSLFSIPFVGLNEDGLPIFINQDGEETITGLNFQEYRKEKLEFLKYEGSMEPTITGSLDNAFRIKNISVNLFLTYAFGNKLRLDPAFRATYSDLGAMPKEFKNRWTLPGDEAHTTIPVIPSREHHRIYTSTGLSYAYNAYNYSTERVVNGGFIRLKDISVAYDFPKSMIGSKVENLQLKLQATNLLLLYADKKLNGQDPEFLNSGGVAAPMPRQFTLTLRMGI